MNKKIKTVLLILVTIIGFSFTQDVSAKVCTYNYSTRQIQVSYDDSHICYYIDGKEGACISNTGIQYSDSGTLYIKNDTNIDDWKNDSDGCLDNLKIAVGTFQRTSTVDAYVFTTSDADQSVSGVVLKPSGTTFAGAKDNLTVTYMKPDGSVQTEEVEFGKQATNIDVVAGEGKDFHCWKEVDAAGCYNFKNPVKHDLILVAEIGDQKYVAGFEQFGKNTTCNGEEIPFGLPYMISRIISLLKMLTPIILIVLGMVDYGKAVISGKEDVMKKCSSAFVRRVFAAVLIFFTVALVQFGFGILGNSGNELFECFDCFVNGICP